MPGPKIFISYSAREIDPVARPGERPDKVVADALVTQLTARGFTPWQDHRRLRTGCEWGKEISEALADCRGALALLSDTSKESEYVRHEASYLSVRKDDEGDAFPFLPIWLGEEVPQDIGAYFHAINLKRFQLGAVPYTAALPIDDIVTLLQPAHDASYCPSTAKNLLEVQLAGEQNLGGIAAAALRGVANKLRWIGDGDQDTWGHPQAVADLFVRHLLAAPINVQYQALNELGVTLRRADRQHFFELVAPFWIEEEAAKAFNDCLDADPGHRAIVVNGTLPNFTPEMLARRHAANLEWSGQSLCPTGDTHAPVGRSHSLLRQARRSICHQLEISEDTDLATLRARIEEKAVFGEPVYSILVDITEDDLDEVQELLQELGDAVFVILTGPEPLDLPGCLRFTPPFRTAADPVPPDNKTRHHELNAQKYYTLARHRLYPT